MILKSLQTQIKLQANPARASQHMRFFKTDPDGYGAGDIFIGLSMPQCRQLAKTNKLISTGEIDQLIQSEIHEERMIALVLMTNRSKEGSEADREEMFEMYVKRMKWVNNWDLVDVSAPGVVGNYLLEKCKGKFKGKGKGREELYDWVQSENMWARRISILSTFPFIRVNEFEDTMRLSQLLLNDKEDLIHKAVGWMLREVGKRDQILLQTFLETNYSILPRTTLRYAIQKFKEPRRLQFLKGKFGSSGQI